MSSNTLSIKPNNHRIYQCPSDKKIALLNKIIEESNSEDILLVCSSEPEDLIQKLQNKDVKVIQDRELVKNKDITCKFLISYDMPIKAIVYMARVARATDKAVMLLDENEQKEVHSIEALLGRAIKQESIEGFGYPVKESTKPQEGARKRLSKDAIKEVAKKRYEESTQEKPKFDKPKFDKPKRDFKNESKKDDKWAKKKKTPNKFLGKDEKGKAIFSGKSGERNHHYDGTPKVTGKRINIKARKPKED